MTEYESYVRHMCKRLGCPCEAERLLKMDIQSALRWLEDWVILTKVAEQAMREYKARREGLFINRAPRSPEGAIG